MVRILVGSPFLLVGILGNPSAQVLHAVKIHFPEKAESFFELWVLGSDLCKPPGSGREEGKGPNHQLALKWGKKKLHNKSGHP